jgi:hypothetical protein
MNQIFRSAQILQLPNKPQISLKMIGKTIFNFWRMVRKFASVAGMKIRHSKLNVLILENKGVEQGTLTEGEGLVQLTSLLR